MVCGGHSKADDAVRRSRDWAAGLGQAWGRHRPSRPGVERRQGGWRCGVLALKVGPMHTSKVGRWESWGSFWASFLLGGSLKGEGWGASCALGTPPPMGGSQEG